MPPPPPSVYGHVSYGLSSNGARFIAAGGGLSVQFVLSADSPRIRQVSTRPSPPPPPPIPKFRARS